MEPGSLDVRNFDFVVLRAVGWASIHISHQIVPDTHRKLCTALTELTTLKHGGRTRVFAFKNAHVSPSWAAVGISVTAANLRQRGSRGGEAC